jgi:AraC family transcriptional regulator of adaptative response/methylated-DNA-[protein]-cysteine methyltransferase
MTAATQTERDPRWADVCARDASADGRFVFAVASTGVYCRPSCPSRRAKPQNVRFFDTAKQAEAAGYRPCLRCNPSALSRAQANAELIAEACRLIEAAEAVPKLADLAARIGLSPAHFHRLFKATTGVTPRAWAAARRAERLQTALALGAASVTHAIQDAGFGSSSRVYERTGELLGMTPTTYLRGGADVQIRFAVADSALGALLVAQSAKGIVAISLGDDPEALVQALQDRFPAAVLVGEDAAFQHMVAEVVGFVEAPQIGLNLPLDLRGTAFQQRVWQALQQIPPGQTLSYAELAGRIGAPAAVRAVAGACAANNVAVAVPCHRIIRANGGLSGYRWGVERKRDLLARERQDLKPKRA